MATIPLYPSTPSTFNEVVVELYPEGQTVSSLAVDVTGIEDQSILMFDASRSTWVTTRTIEKHFINGGQY